MGLWVCGWWISRTQRIHAHDELVGKSANCNIGCTVLYETTLLKVFTHSCQQLHINGNVPRVHVK